MKKDRKIVFLKNFIIVLVMISFSFITGYSIFQQINKVAAKPSLNIDPVESIEENNEEIIDEEKNSHIADKDKLDDKIHENDIINNGNNENDDEIDNSDIEDKSDSHDNTNNDNVDNNENTNNNDSTDTNSNGDNKDTSGGNNYAEGDSIDENSGVNEESNPQNKPADNNKIEAKPVADIIRSSSNKASKRVAITFDDGPDGYFTPQILDILKEHDVKATFFIVGSIANKNRDVLKRIDEEGHVVASHSWGHYKFTEISDKKIIQELQKTNKLIEEVTGKPTTLFRLPYGAFNKRVLKTVANQGYHNIFWSVDPRDWSGISPKKIVDNIMNKVEPGAIILLHSFGSKESIPNTVKALPSIIESLQEQGYEMVTITELLNDDLFVNSTTE